MKFIIKLLRIVCVLFFLISSNNYIFAGEYGGLRFDEGQLKQIAVREGFGFKYANLQELKKLTDKFNEQEKVEYKIEVPFLFGIPSEKILLFLKNQDPEKLDVADKWGLLIKEFFTDKKIKDRTLETKKYPEGFIQEREKLEKEIEEAFNRIINKAKEQGSEFKFDESFEVKGIDNFIYEVAKRGELERLMVRSTGKEDTRELANAGGNETVSNVNPEIISILEAMKKVVASYFGAKSLTQRLGAGDPSIFEIEPFCPVLLQWMIGEKDPKKLPKCGVMFTEETEGGISRYEKKDETGKIKTTGLTVIQSAYGHNEGVVNSLIPVDTYYVDEKENIYPVIVPKTHRMVPAGEGKLELKKNEDLTLVIAPALTREALIALKKFSNVLENYYGYPMDVEFVVNEENKTIYIVQARPIVHNKEQIQPSYLQNIDAIPAEQKAAGSAIGVAGGALRWIDNKDQIIVKSNIGEALSAYQTVPDSKKIQAIIVGKMAPSTSHEATTFRSEQKLVIYMPDWQKVEKWAEGKKLIVSPQQGLVVNTQGLGWEENSLEELLQNTEIAKKGWESYPIPRFVSLTKEFAPEERLTNEAIKSFADGIKIKALKGITFKDLIKDIKQGDEQSASEALVKYLLLVRNLIGTKTRGIIWDEDIAKRIDFLTRYALEFAKRTKNTLKFDSSNMQYPERLFTGRFLESLFLQQPSPEEIVDGFSVTTIAFKESSKEQEIMQKLRKAGFDLKTLDPRTVQYLKLSEIALTPELAGRWLVFVKMLNNNPDDKLKNDFAKLILDLGKFGMLPIWLATSFDQAYDDMKKSGKEDLGSELAKILIEEVNSQDELLKKLAEKRAEIQAFNVSAFADPKNFKTQWSIFNKILEYFLSDDFLDAYKKANDLGKLAVNGTMKKLVDTFDLSIKALTGSSQYKDTDKVIRFRLMLLQYAELFKKFVDLVPEGAIVCHPHSPLSSYLKYINTILSEEKPHVGYLQGTAGFNASAFTIGSGVNITNNLIEPKSLEDVFTIIHQSLLVVIRALNAPLKIERIKKPKLLIQAEEMIKKLSRAQTPSFLGIDLNDTLMSLFYNLPLREHSVQFELEYYRQTKKILLSVIFFGHDPQRWQNIATYAFMLGKANEMNTKEIAVKQDGVSLTFILDDKTNLSKMLEYIENMVRYSFGEVLAIDYESLWSLIRLDEGFILDIPKNFNFLLLWIMLLEKLDKMTEAVKKLVFREAIEAAGEGIKSANYVVLASALNLFKALVERSQGVDVEKEKCVDKAIEAASEGIKSANYVVLASALDLFKALVEKSQGVDVEKEKGADKAIEAATEGIKSLDRWVRDSALRLFQVLFEKEKGFDKAIEAAGEGINSTNYMVRASALDLFRALVKKSQGFDEAIEAATEGINSTNYMVRASALDLFRALIEKEKNLNKIFSVAEQIKDEKLDELIAKKYLGIKNKLLKVQRVDRKFYEKVLDEIENCDENNEKKQELLELTYKLLLEKSIYTPIQIQGVLNPIIDEKIKQTFKPEEAEKVLEKIKVLWNEKSKNMKFIKE